MRCDALKVLFLASEADPLVKVGGLADVAGSLPRALQQLTAEEAGDGKIEVRLVLPFHSAIKKKSLNPAFLFDFPIPVTDGEVTASVFFIEVNGIRTYLISGPPIPEDGPVYSSDPAVDGPKYVFFSLAALELAKRLEWQPDILHGNDWHTALSVYGLHIRRKSDPFYRNVRSVLTIHNLPFMGAGTEAAFDYFNLPSSEYALLPWWARKVPLPLGLQSADRIVAVSPNYAREITTPEYGCGLDTFLKTREKSIFGILNGLDQDNWDPARDTIIPNNYSLNSLACRQANKDALACDFSLNKDPEIPLIILISRMDPQKGVDLAVEGLRQTMDLPWQAILLGSGNPRLEYACQQLADDFPERIKAVIRFDIPLSRRLYSGADILLMPSRYEPCGLAQMMAMRYGCVPLARATGGLQDTILDENSFIEGGTGFLFQTAEAGALSMAIRSALQVFPDRKRWCGIQERGMKQDFSWERSALEYSKIYHNLLEVKL